MNRPRKILGVLAVVVLVGGPSMALAQSHGGHGHAHGKHNALMIDPGPMAPSVAMTITKDAVAGWNVHIKATNFRFSPENASRKHVAGEGHAHLYVDGKKIARVYGSWFHIDKLPEKGGIIRVTLNTNDHRDIMVGGKLVEASQALGKAMKHGHHN